MGEVGEGPVRGLLRALWNIAKVPFTALCQAEQRNMNACSQALNWKLFITTTKIELGPCHGSWVITDQTLQDKSSTDRQVGRWVIQEIHIDPLAVSRLSKHVDINNVEMVVQIKFHKILDIYLYAMLCAVLAH